VKQGVLKIFIIYTFFVSGFKTSVVSTVPRGPYFSLGPIVGFSFTKTPRSRDVDEKGIGATRYDKVGHSFNGGFVGNIFYKLSKERVIGLQLCIFSTKLKDMHVPNSLSLYNSISEEGDEKGGDSGENPDTSEYENIAGQNTELIDRAKLKYTDLLVVFKYDVTWARTAILCGVGISKCNCTPSNRRMKTNLGYVVNGAVDYDINKNLRFMTGVRIRHHAKKEKFGAKNNSSLNNLNIETGLIMSF